MQWEREACLPTVREVLVRASPLPSLFRTTPGFSEHLGVGEL